jgi:putative peptidoglycan lipid II flippase
VRGVAIAAAVVALGNVVSRLLGLLREAVMAALFGATGATDVFVAASAVPQIVYDLLVGGAISAALVPIFVDAAEEERRFWQLISSVLALAAAALTVVAVALGLSAPQVVSVLAAGFSPEQQAAAVPMVRIMLAAVVLQGLAGVLMAVSYARHRFGPPAFAPAAYNGGIILGALLLHQILGVYALVVGVLVGAFAQLLLQLPVLGGRRHWPRIDLESPEVRAILRLYGPVALGMIVTVVGIVIDRNLASRLSEGSLSVMNYATRLIQFPLGLVAMALSAAVLPSLSRYSSTLAQPGGAGDSAGQGYVKTLQFGIRAVLLLILPATIGLIVLREPLIQLLFERGRFGEAETARAAIILLAYSPQLPFTALDQLFIVAFYARKDTRTPVAVGVVGVFVYLASALALIGPLEAAGLALANAIQNSFHGLVLLILLERLGRAEGIGALMDRSLSMYIARVLIAALLMGLVLLVITAHFATGQGAIGLALPLAIAALAGAGVYVAALELLGVRDLRAAMRALRRPTPL